MLFFFLLPSGNSGDQIKAVGPADLLSPERSVAAEQLSMESGSSVNVCSALAGGRQELHHSHLQTAHCRGRSLGAD